MKILTEASKYETYTYRGEDLTPQAKHLIRHLTVDVTAVPSNYFKGCKKLESVVFTNNVKIIYENAFDGCTSLSGKLELTSVEQIKAAAFYDCGFTEVVLTGEVSNCTISTKAFNGCLNLQSVIIANYVTNIESYAFYNCSNLQSVSFSDGDNLIHLGESAFSGTGITTLDFNQRTVSDGKNQWADFALCSMTNLTTLKLPSKMQVLPSNLLYNSKKVNHITYPQNLEILENDSLSHCSVDVIWLPDSVKTIEGNNFIYMNNLHTILIPDSVETLGKYCFFQSHNLKQVVIKNADLLLSHNEVNNPNKSDDYPIGVEITDNIYQTSLLDTDED